jgi:lipoprotein-releasing system permease protein
MSATHPACIWRLILRYLLRRGINAFAISAVFLSIACLFTVNAVFKGFDSELQKMFRGSLADVLVEWRWNNPPLSEVGEKLQGYVHAPALESFGMLRARSYVTSVSFKGIDPEAEAQLRKAMGLTGIALEQLQTLGATKSPMGGLLSLFGEGDGETEHPMVMGDMLAERLDLQVGDSVKLLAPNWKEQVGQKNFVIKSLFHSGYLEDDSGKVYIHIDDARDLQQYPGGYSTIQVALAKGQTVGALKTHLEAEDPDVRVNTWRDRHHQRMMAVAHERKLIAIVLSMIVVVASFGILSIQWSFVKEKTRDIGVLQAMGFSKTSLFLIFLGVSWMVGITGLILGLGGGAIISTYANEILAITGWRPFPGELYYHDHLPVSLEWGDVLWISILSLSVTTLAGLCPAWRATRVDPVEAIGYE